MSKGSCLMDLATDLHIVPSAMTTAGDSLTSTEKVNSLQKKHRKTKREQGQAVEQKDKAPEFPVGDSSWKTDATMKDTLHKSPDLPDLSSSQTIVKRKRMRRDRRRRRKAQRNSVQSNFNGCDNLDISQGENGKKEQNMLQKAAENSNGECDVQEVSCNCNSVGKAVEHKDKGPEFPVGDSSRKTDATMKDPFHESPDFPDLSSSQTIVEHNSKKMKHQRKMRKTQHNSVQSNFNGCDNPGDISQGETGEKEQNMLQKAAENSNGECDVQEVNSVGKAVEHKDKGLELTVGDSSRKTDATMKDTLHKSPDLPDLSSSQTIVKRKRMRRDRRRRRKAQRNSVQSNFNGCDNPADISKGENGKKEQNMLQKAAENNNGDCDVQEVSCNYNSVGKAVEHKDKGPEFPVGDSSRKTDATMKDPFHESPDLPDLSSSQTIVEHNSKKMKHQRKMRKTQHNSVQSNFDGCDNPVIGHSCVIADISQGENGEKEQNMLQKAAENINGECDVQEVNFNCNSVGKAVELKDKGPEFPVGDSSRKTDATMKDTLHKSPDLPDLSSSQTIVEQNSKKKKHQRKMRKTQHNSVQSNFNSCDNPDISQGENGVKEKNMLQKAAENSNGECDVREVNCNCNSVGKAVEHKDKGLEFLVCDSSRKTDATMKDTLHKSPDLPDLSSSQTIVKHRRKRRKTQHNSVKSNFNGCDNPADISQGENGVKEQNMLQKTAENSNGECDVQEVCCNCNSVVADAVSTAEESVIEFTEKNIKQNINDNITNPEEKSTFVKNASLGKKHDDDNVGVCLSVKIPHVYNREKMSLDRTVISYPKKKLLILDVNGLLVDLVSDDSKENNITRKPDFRVSRRKGYYRPFCNDFLRFCFDRFHVGVWSSRKRTNLDRVIELVMGKSAYKLLFRWNQYHCTRTKFKTVEDVQKPIFLKELRLLWEKRNPRLPWNKGEFNESNTLLLDDSPYKALLNPKHTAVFPYTYQYHDIKDSSLGPEGDLRVYLKGLAMAENVQEYVSSNPFGQPPITETNPSWGYYCQVLESVKHERRLQNQDSGPHHQVGSKLLCKQRRMKATALY
ncbi:uncharacterized protein LOC130734792 isoform X4 [Lotus japonicus]|uniref:uncharacterized protein LOC130734792 isoform X4 n=1 Tax=Lotus japonicus TaxID=34305 RepID=UPI00258C656D|nr:uncharacterized protein LOC130734792 isoform X4 [Lotus japonicus]